MRIFGLDIRVTRALPTATQPPLHDRGNWWWPIIREPFTGAWQRNMELRVDTITTYFAVYSCVSLIATDIGKLRLRLMRQSNDGIWEEAQSPAFSPVLRKPNHYQTRNKFIETWMLSRLLHGNTFVLKERDDRGVVVRLYVLDPLRTKVLVAPNSDIFYELSADNLSGLPQPITVPASEIIHDIMVPLFHPLCGVSPLMAAALPVLQGLSIQRESNRFFAGGSHPGGILSSPHEVTEQQARDFKTQWETNFSGENSGRIAVVGNGMKYEQMAIPAEEAQLIEQLKWTAQNVASVFHVPPYMIGIETPPQYNNVEALQQVYYSQCLQSPIENIEALLDEGLGLGNDRSGTYRTEFDLDDLLRMDTATQIESVAKGVAAGIFAPNEARAKFNLPPTKGGESPYLQQQNFSLEALAERDEAQAELLAQPPPSPDEPPPEQVNAERIYRISRSLN